MTIAGLTFTVNQNGPCSFSISPTSATFGAKAGGGSVTVSTTAGCGWTAVSNTGFITILSGASGTGSGTVNYSVSQNTSGSIRTGTMTIAGFTFNVTQAGSSCITSISPTSASFGPGVALASVSVTAGGNCSWTAVSLDSFITITGGSSGFGNGTVKYSVAANPGPTPRSGSIIIGNLVHTVNQAGAP
jgi:BACON domain-containing protein